MIDRFKGPEGHRRLIAALRSQQIVRDDEAVAAALAEVALLREFIKGTHLITQGSSDNELFFVLSGRVAIVVNNREIAFRKAGNHVGEMALIDVSASRSASVVAAEDTVVAIIEEGPFSRIADLHPKLWRNLAIELSARLRERNKFVKIPNSRPVLFIGSSKESLAVAQYIQNALLIGTLAVRIWTDDVFWPSHSAIEDLVQQLELVDFALLVFGPDDLVLSRNVVHEGPRDNVLLELGMFIGALGRERAYFLRPLGIDMKIPSDLFGVIPLEYDPRNQDGLLPVCDSLRRVIEKLGPK